MPKLNVNSASRDELVEAGVRAELAEEILKLRRKGKVDIDALNALPGVGPVTLEQLRKTLDFSDKAASNGHDEDRATKSGESSIKIAKQAERRVEETAQQATEAAVSTVRSGAEAARSTAESGARITSIAAPSGLEAVRRTVEATAEVERETLSRAADGTSQLSQMLLELVNEQARHNAETLTALSRAVDWRRIFELQSELVQANLERTAEFARRYFELSQAVMTSALSAANRQVRKTA